MIANMARAGLVTLIGILSVWVPTLLFAPAIVGAVIGAAMVVVGYAVLKLVLEPVQEQRKVIGRVVAAQSNFANVNWLWSVEKQLEATDALRLLSGELQGASRAVLLYDIATSLRFVPSRNAVKRASDALIGWSNTVSGPDTAEGEALMRGFRRDLARSMVELNMDWAMKTTAEEDLWVALAEGRP